MRISECVQLIYMGKQVQKSLLLKTKLVIWKAKWKIRAKNMYSDWSARNFRKFTAFTFWSSNVYKYFDLLLYIQNLLKSCSNDIGFIFRHVRNQKVIFSALCFKMQIRLDLPKNLTFRRMINGHQKSIKIGMITSVTLFFNMLDSPTWKPILVMTDRMN